MSVSTAHVLVRVDLEIREPWAIGATGTAGDVIALPVLTDPRSSVGPNGMPFLPATSLVGSLRRHLGPTAVHWLGAELGTQDDPATPSRLRCLGVELSGARTIQSRTTTEIDPVRQAARGHQLRAAEHVDASAGSPTTLRWWLQVDEPVAPAQQDELVVALLAWRPFVGRRRSTGQGAASVTGVHLVALDLADSGHLRWWLSERAVWDGVSEEYQPPGWGPATIEDLGQSSPPPTRSVLQRTLTAVEPLFVGNAQWEKHGDSGTRQVSLPQVPGSSWKGLFRQRVAHILTVCGYDRAGLSPEILLRLFGSARSGGSSTAAGERGVLRFLTSDLTGAATVTRTHVAIDRITGGARSRSFTSNEGPRGGSLFSVEAIAPGATLLLIVEASTNLSELEQLLLDHVAHDVASGLVGVGGFTSRGYGTLMGDDAAPSPVPRPPAPTPSEDS